MDFAAEQRKRGWVFFGYGGLSKKTHALSKKTQAKVDLRDGLRQCILRLSVQQAATLT